MIRFRAAHLHCCYDYSIEGGGQLVHNGWKISARIKKGAEGVSPLPRCCYAMLFNSDAAVGLMRFCVDDAVPENSFSRVS